MQVFIRVSKSCRFAKDQKLKVSKNNPFRPVTASLPRQSFVAVFQWLVLSSFIQAGTSIHVCVSYVRRQGELVLPVLRMDGGCDHQTHSYTSSTHRAAIPSSGCRHESTSPIKQNSKSVQNQTLKATGTSGRVFQRG
jgi:hypothetical protein